MAIDIANGLLECHKHGIIHSDLKADNILVDERLVLKISGFDLSITKVEMEFGNKAGGNALKWRAPERFTYDKRFERYRDNPSFVKIFNETMAKIYLDQPHLSDVSEVNKLLGELIVGEVTVGENDMDPVSITNSLWISCMEIATNGMRLYSNIKDGVELLEVKTRDDIDDLVVILKLKDTPTLLKHVVKQCCKFDPNNRISLEEVVFELLNKFQNLHGETLILMDRHEDSLTDLNKLLEIRQDDAYVLNIRGKVHRMMNNYEESLVDLNKSLEINSNNADALRNRGITYYRMCNYNESLSYLNKSLDIDQVIQ
ncbi:hypothetical protein C2G38_2170590 [Gigaspora rosea]|uniref:Protein kinase domain-containing protein n=1 Tax=Gigaspora rosea TaxID=44941 RepID=A0A397VUJ9_9GLOM|nr:hypothetical protein C2G38_2170590 [Gigaspora rosea]